MEKFIFNIFGTTKHRIKINSVCPDCGIINGIVTGDKNPIFYNRNFVIISEKELKQVPQKKCGRIFYKK